MLKVRDKKKRAIGDIDDPTKDELYNGINKMQEPYKSCAAFLYLTGNRVSEVLGIPARENDRSDNASWVTHPLKRSAVEVMIDRPIMRVKARTLKRKGRPVHTYTVRINTPEEQRYFELIKEHLESTPTDAFLWNISRFRLWKSLNKATGLPPHKLRGLRATRDAVEFELDAIDLKAKFNWSNPAMAFHYASKSSHNIEDKLLRK